MDLDSWTQSETRCVLSNSMVQCAMNKRTKFTVVRHTRFCLSQKTVESRVLASTFKTR